MSADWRNCQKVTGKPVAELEKLCYYVLSAAVNVELCVYFVA